jgi:hypothetical protein
VPRRVYAEDPAFLSRAVAVAEWPLGQVKGALSSRVEGRDAQAVCLLPEGTSVKRPVAGPAKAANCASFAPAPVALS